MSLFFINIAVTSNVFNVMDLYITDNVIILCYLLLFLDNKYKLLLFSVSTLFLYLVFMNLITHSHVTNCNTMYKSMCA